MRRFFQRLLRPRLRTLRPLPSQQAYRLWAGSYPAHAHNPLMALEEQTMRDLMPDLQGLTVLDLACGTGRYARIAVEGRASCAFGVDNSADMLRRSEVKGVAQSDMSTLPFPDNAFDVVLCGLAVGHLRDPGSTLKEASRVLRRGGMLLLSDLHPFQALKGAQRTFAGPDGQLYAVEHYPHLWGDYLRWAESASLRMDAIAEPALPEQGNQPVVLVLRLTRV